MVRPRELPDSARVVIIGGGVGGTSIAYHLAKLGERDVVLLDRNELTSGSTFHSAGLVGQLRSSVSLTRMMMNSVELYRTLDCGWVQCGGIRLACTPEREQEVLRQVAWAKTFDSLRLEKGYRVWAADITPDETPYEAGLGFCVRKQGGFIGAPALGLGEGEKGSVGRPSKRLRCLALDDPRSVALGNEPVRIGNQVLGRVTSGGYGYTVKRSIAYAYVPAEVELGTSVEVDIFGRWVPGLVTREPLFDPKGERVRV
jgi:hypothetical protein